MYTTVSSSAIPLQLAQCLYEGEQSYYSSTQLGNDDIVLVLLSSSSMRRFNFVGDMRYYHNGLPR